MTVTFEGRFGGNEVTNGRLVPVVELGSIYRTVAAANKEGPMFDDLTNHLQVDEQTPHMIDVQEPDERLKMSRSSPCG